MSGPVCLPLYDQNLHFPFYRELGGLRSCSSERLLLRPLLKVSRTVNTFLCPQNASPSRRGAIAPPSLSLHGIKFSEASLWSPVHFLPVEPIPRIRQDFGTTTTPSPNSADSS